MEIVLKIGNKEYKIKTQLLKSFVDNGLKVNEAIIGVN
jgi:hypothetical protein